MRFNGEYCDDTQANICNTIYAYEVYPCVGKNRGNTVIYEVEETLGTLKADEIAINKAMNEVEIVSIKPIDNTELWTVYVNFGNFNLVGSFDVYGYTEDEVKENAIEEIKNCFIVKEC